MVGMKSLKNYEFNGWVFLAIALVAHVGREWREEEEEEENDEGSWSWWAMRKVSIKKAAEEFESLSEEERRALRISRFHAMPVLSSSSASSSQHSQPRLAHPGGPLATNKAVALGKFLKRKLSEPGGAASLDPALVEQAVNNAKATVEAGKGQLLKSGVKVLHVDSFSAD
jgi:hypothetical protein